MDTMPQTHRPTLLISKVFLQKCKMLVGLAGHTVRSAVSHLAASSGARWLAMAPTGPKVDEARWRRAGAFSNGLGDSAERTTDAARTRYVARVTATIWTMRLTALRMLRARGIQ